MTKTEKPLSEKRKSPWPLLVLIFTLLLVGVFREEALWAIIGIYVGDKFGK